MKKDGYTFEGFIEYLFGVLLNLRGEGIAVSRNATLVSKSGNAHEIDIFYQFTKANVPHKVGIECKDWKSPVDKGRVQEFEAKIRDLGDLRPVMISPSGYQSGAKQFGESKGILMLEQKDLPTFHESIGMWLKAFLLPEENEMGEPFWILMEKDTRLIHCTRQNGEDTIPLFISKIHAEQYMSDLGIKGYYVQGFPQHVLKAHLLMMLQDKKRNVSFVSYFITPKNWKMLGGIPMMRWPVKKVWDEFVWDKPDISNIT